MKKTSTLLALAFGAFATCAQTADVSATLVSPAANSNIGPGQPFVFEITVTNSGNVPILATDTILYAPLLNNNFLTSNGQPIAFARYEALAPGASVTYTQNFGGLSIQGAGAMQVDFCGLAAVFGPAWLNESDSINNVDCNSVNYVPGVVGLYDVLQAASKPVNTTYFYNNTLFVQVDQVVDRRAELLVIDLTGKVVYSQSLMANDFRFREEIALNLSKGLYVVNIRSGRSHYGSTKISVQ